MNPRYRSARLFAVLLSLASTLAAGCSGGQGGRPVSIAMQGNPRSGQKLIVAKGCGSCHVVPGIYSARGLVGPPLYFFGRRTMIAGELPNTPDNLVRWLRDPKAIEPGTAMPNLGLNQQQAQDIAAYLYTLQ